MVRMLEDSWVGTEPAYTHSDLRTRGLDHSCGAPALARPGCDCVCVGRESPRCLSWDGTREQGRARGIDTEFSAIEGSGTESGPKDSTQD